MAFLNLFFAEIREIYSLLRAEPHLLRKRRPSLWAPPEDKP